MKRARRPHNVTDADYKALAEFRYQIRQYLRLGDEAARDAGLEPQQYLLLLAIKGMSSTPTIGTLAKSLTVKSQSLTELVDRASDAGLVTREKIGAQVFVSITKAGNRVLKRIVKHRIEDMKRAGPALIAALQELTHHRDRS